MSIQQNLRNLAAKWGKVAPAERANYQLYLVDLAEALEIERPQPRGSGYEFEFPISIVNPNGSTTTKFADLYKVGYFLLEAKDEDAVESRDILMRRAFGQARQYAAWVAGSPPPYLLALDVGTTLMVWDRWSGSYGDYHGGYRIHLPTLADRPDDIAFLRDIWANPHARDPRGRAEAVTREIAGHLAELANSLEARGHDPELVARFLIRCVFTMFAEDVGLLPDEPFHRAVRDIGLEDPAEFTETVEELWKAMDEGGRFGLRKYLRFNGHFFKDRRALLLTSDDLRILLEAARADWADVEPSIMGTLLTRALNSAERHKLGAEYTPREFVERLVRPTVEEPIRERWTRVQAEVLQLRSRTGKTESTRKKHERQALESLRSFHEWLRGLRFLDPACGSGNFLYVTLNIVKQIELEVLRAIEEITLAPELAVEEVGPWQFHGIEVKAWAREIAELTLWIGFHQWWRRTHGHVQPPEPVLRDTGTLEHRDAVLAWDEVHEDPQRSRPDSTPRIKHPVTGKMVPDPDARIPYLAHLNARPAPWPKADFIVGNPPYMGSRRMRTAFGDGYVEALRAAYSDVPNNVDYVMYWWHRAAREVATGRTIRAGLITTNSIVQAANRAVVSAASDAGAGVVWAIPDHPWVDETGSAAVRVAMTVIARSPERATLVIVDQRARVVQETQATSLNTDLTAHADIATASGVPLKANRGLAGRGVILRGAGFELAAEEGKNLLNMAANYADVVRPWLSGVDLVDRDRGHFVIDFGTMSIDRAVAYAVPLQIVRDRVQPERAGKKEKAARDFWWQFWRPRPDLRAAIEGLTRYILTPYVSKHRFFVFADPSAVPDDNLVGIGLDDGYSLGVLSSRIHSTWSDAAGGRMGVGNDPRYNAGCFDAFPFPSPDEPTREKIATVAERIERHRRDALSRDGRVTTTGLYNVVAKIRFGEELSADERLINQIGACGLLRDLHDELDALVAKAYGWPWPMDREETLMRLVALHDARVEEERKGNVHWLRPDFQVPRFGQPDMEAQALGLTEQGEAVSLDAPEWPATTIEQIAALQDLLAGGSITVAEAAASFRGARRDHVARHLETLALMGEASVGPDGAYYPVRQNLVAA